MKKLWLWKIYWKRANKEIERNKEELKSMQTKNENQISTDCVKKLKTQIAAKERTIILLKESNKITAEKMKKRS